MVTIPESKYAEIRAGEKAWFEFITSCTVVYVRSTAGRVVVYHWPMSAIVRGSADAMRDAVQSIGATGKVSLIKLFTKSLVGLDELISHLRKYTHNIETTKLEKWQEPMIDFEGRQLV
jgi:hypothetical protein